MHKLHNPPEAKDIDVWQEAVSDILPTNQPPEIPSASLVIKEVTPSVRMENVYNANSFTKLVVGDISNIDGSLADKFLKGKLKIDARLDLHGKTEKQAFTSVEKFIYDSFGQGCRCVLIITGKGRDDYNKPWFEATGIIRDALPSWLNHPDIRPFILSMAPASIADGGSGAMYVLLKRNKQLP